MTMSIETLAELLTYNPETGELRWKPGIKGRGGRIAGRINDEGYRRIRLNGKQFAAHRVAFFMYHGRLPNQVDHANGVRDDNRSANLRECTGQQNRWNSKKPSNAKASKLKGVSFSADTGRWMARITVNNRTIYLGLHGTQEEAHAAYVEAASKHFKEFAHA